MKNSWIISKRELKERLTAGSFWVMAFAGPLLITGLVYMLFALGGNNKAQWKILVSDPAGILENRMLPTADQSIQYDFIGSYVEVPEFEKGNRYQQYDALLEVNEKVLSNKVAYVFYREKPSVKTATKIQFQFERRLEEIMLVQFTSLSLSDFKKIKQPINLGFRNVYDPKDEASNLGGWVGFIFGTVIILFIFLFGMTILRSTSREKSNRIVEVLLAAVKPRELMLGKIIGIGLAALIQFIIWVTLIAAGLYLIRTFIFPDMLDAANLNFDQMTAEVRDSEFMRQAFAAKDYNNFVELVYERIQFGSMLVYFCLFFIAGYLFYGTFFTALGALSGSESDGQQFVLPLIAIMVFSLYAGYHAMLNPSSDFTSVVSYLPFTSPVVCMVKLAQGYAPGQGYLLFISFFILLFTAFLFLIMTGRLYKNSILQFGHRLRLKDIVKWSKKA